MAEPLVNRYGPEIPRRIALMVSKVHPRFPAQPFLRQCRSGYDALNLMARGGHIAQALRDHLPPDYPEAVDILVRSLEPRVEVDAGEGMASFVYLPHGIFVARHGLGHFEESMRALHEITRRFTAEFAIRPFLEHEPRRTLDRLAEWASDPDPHVRRLVSEGTRPRLPWAPRLRDFQRDPAPVLALLERLKDDPERYVVRSVANNLNDIGKDHPDVLLEVAKRWLRDAGPERRWLVRHAMRSRLKAGDAGALAALGFGEGGKLGVSGGRVTPARAKMGGSVTVAFTVENRGRRAQSVHADFRIHYVKANGRTAPKVFKLGARGLAPGESARFEKRVSLAPMTTRRHYAGVHAVEAVVNGRVTPVGSFRLAAG